MKQGLESNESALLAFALSIVAGLAVFIFNANIAGPTIQPDEGSYLAIAAAIVGYANDLAGSYYGGYSIFIAPAFLIADAPEAVWLLVRVINAILFACSVFGLFLLAKYFAPTHTLQQKSIAVGVVSSYPAWVVMAGYSSSQVAFVPVFLFMVISYLRAVDGEVGHWLVLGVVSGFLYWIHPTAVASVIAVICGAFYIAFRRNRYELFVIFLLMTLSMIFVYRQGMAFLVQEQMSVSGHAPNYHYPDAVEFLSPLISLAGLKEVVARIAGQIFYFSLGTVGLFWLGLFTLTPKLSGEGRLSGKVALQESALAIFIWLALAGTIMMTALQFTSTVEAQRLDQWIYGRYVEPVMAPVLLAGIFNISSSKILWSIPIAIFCTWVFYSEIDSYTHVLRVNIPALWQDYYLHEQGVWGWLMAGIVLIFTVAVVPLPMRAIVIIAIFSFSSYLHIRAHIVASEGVKTRWTEALAVREQFEPGICVGFDHSRIESYNEHSFWVDFNFILYDYQLQRMSFEYWLEHCNGPLFSYSNHLNNQHVKVYSLGSSPLGGPITWMKR